jgi:AraC-like DNA-binding protein
MGAGFSTAALRPRDRVGGWADEIARRFGAQIAAKSGAFNASIETAFVGKVTVSEITGSPVVVTRSERDVSRLEMDIFTLGVLLDGNGVIAQSGREARIGAGDLVLADCRSPYRIRFEGPFRQLVLTLERSSFEARLPHAAHRTALRVDGQSGPGRVASACVNALREQAPHLGVTVDALGECALDMVALAFGGDLSDASQAAAGRQHFLLRRIKTFIEAHLGDAQLTPDSIANRHGISRRYLYGLFETEQETVSGYIWQRRLAHCREALADPQRRDRNISEIAFQWGFNDASHFCRAFRRAFGMSPRDFRLACARKP